MSHGTDFLRATRSIRAILYLIGIAVLVPVLLVSVYISIGSPAFSVKERFRREEMAQAVGPGKILDDISLENYSIYDYNSLIIATTDQGVSLFLYRDRRYFRLIHRQKQGDVTVFAVPNDTSEMCLGDYYMATEINIPVIVFDDIPEAVHAELEMELSGSGGSLDYGQSTSKKQYKLHADRQEDGYFLFDLTASNSQGLRAEGIAIFNLTLLTDDYTHVGLIGKPVPVTVRFYDKNDALICTKTVEVCTSSGLE